MTTTTNHARIDDIIRTEQVMHHAIDRKGRIKHLMEASAWDDHAAASRPLDNVNVVFVVRKALARKYASSDIDVHVGLRDGMYTVTVTVDGMTMRARPDRTKEARSLTGRIEEQPLTNGEVARQVFESLAEEAHVLMMEAIDLYGAACLQD